MSESELLLTELREVEHTLKSTLGEACGTDVARADTGELIKVEEMLAIASDAAKQAISIRRKRKQSAASGPPARRQGSDSEVPLPSGHRLFLDADGAGWTVRAFHPAEREDARHTRLLGSYQQGWLSFESEVGKRRLSPIPQGWQSLDDASLRALCARAEEAAPRRTEDHRR